MKSEQGGHEPRLGLSGIDGIAELDFLEWVRDRLRLPAAAPLSLISIPEGGIGLDFPSWLIHRVVLCILPPFAPFGVTDRDWTPVWGGGITAADLDPAGAAGQTRFWIATRVAAFEDEDCFRVCVSWDVQIRVFINTPVIDMLVGVSEQLRDTLEEFNEGPLTDDEAANMGWSPPAHTRAGVYAHEQAHVQLARAALATTRVRGSLPGSPRGARSAALRRPGRFRHRASRSAGAFAPR